jgi:carbohydrate-selective porin OprB
VPGRGRVSRNSRDIAATYNLGGYDDSLSGPDLANPKILHQGLFGFYFATAPQSIKMGGGEHHRPTLSASFTVSDQNTTKFKNAYDAGIASRGLFADRPLDVISLG